MISNSIGINDFWAFVLGTTLTAIVPGANTYRVLDSSYRFGPSGGIWSSFGVILADITFMVAAAFGLASLFSVFPPLYGLMLLFGGCYFLNMAIAVLRNPNPANHKFANVNGEIQKFTERKTTFIDSYMTCVSNFKAIFFYTLFFPKFIDPTFQPSWLPFLFLCLTVLIILTIYYASLSLAGVWLFSSKNGVKFFKFVTLFFGVFIGLLSLRLFQEFYKFVA